MPSRPTPTFHRPERARSWSACATLAVSSAILALLCTACSGDICNRGNDDAPAPFRSGETNGAGTEYMTNGIREPYLDFRSGQRYRLFHDLQDVPTLIVPYVSFSPTPAVDGSGFAISPGNQTVIRQVTDEYIDVENDTCTHFYLRVVASVASAPPPSPAPAVDAGSGVDGGS